MEEFPSDLENSGVIWRKRSCFP